MTSSFSIVMLEILYIFNSWDLNFEVSFKLLMKAWVLSCFVQGVISQIPEVILKCVSRDEAALAVAQKVC